MDNEYGTMFERLMNERNELRKYIIDICKLLDINTDQFLLGANCLGFYVVLCSTAEDKIGDLQEQLKRKEEECEELKEKYKWFDHYKEQALFNKNLCNEKSDKIDQLKAENEQIKKYLGISSKTIMERLEELQEFRDRDRDKLYQAEQKLKKIRGIAKDFHYVIIPFHRGINHEMADRIDYYLNQILQIIDEVEEQC